MELKPTTKVAEALAVAQRAAQAAGHPEITPAHLALALAEQEGTTTPALLAAAGSTAEGMAATARSVLSGMPRSTGATVATPALGQAALSVLQQASTLMAARGDTYLSTDVLLLALLEKGAVQGDATALEAQIDHLRGGRQGRQRGPGGHRRGPREVRHGPHRGRPRGSARPGHRPRRRDPPRRAGALPPHQEQPRADRRARRRQDRRRRGARPAHRRRRRARVAARQAADRARPRRDGRRREVPRRVRGAAQGRARGDQGVRRPGRHLHRRAAHRRRGRRHRRVGHGRQQHAQADAGPRRAAPGRRDDPRRVPRARREGPRPRAPLPAGLRRRAVGRGHHRHPARPQGALRGAPQGRDRGQRARRGGVALRPLHPRPPAARQGDRPRRRGRLPAADGDRLQPGRDRRAPACRRPAEDGGAAPREGDRRGVRRAARPAARRPRREDRGARGAHRPLGVGEVRAQPGRRPQGPARRPAHPGRPTAARG